MMDVHAELGRAKAENVELAAKLASSQDVLQRVKASSREALMDIVAENAKLVAAFVEKKREVKRLQAAAKEDRKLWQQRLQHMEQELQANKLHIQGLIQQLHAITASCSAAAVAAAPALAQEAMVPARVAAANFAGSLPLGDATNTVGSRSATASLKPLLSQERSASNGGSSSASSSSQSSSCLHRHRPADDCTPAAPAPADTPESKLSQAAAADHSENKKQQQQHVQQQADLHHSSRDQGLRLKAQQQQQRAEQQQQQQQPAESSVSGAGADHMWWLLQQGQQQGAQHDALQQQQRSALRQQQLAELRQQQQHLEREKQLAEQQQQLAALQQRARQLEAENTALKAAQAEADELRVRMECMQQAEQLKQQGNRLYQSQQYAAAVAAYSEALALGHADPTFNAVVLCNRAAALHSSGSFLDAIADCCTAEQLDSQYPRVLQRRADALLALEDYSGAVADLTRLLELQGPGSSSREAAAKLREAQQKLRLATGSSFGAVAGVPDHYQVLSLAQGAAAAAADVKAAYKKLALQHHPDKAQHTGRAAADAVFRLVAAAYAVLSDPAQRSDYDLARQAWQRVRKGQLSSTDMHAGPRGCTSSRHTAGSGATYSYQYQQQQAAAAYAASAAAAAAAAAAVAAEQARRHSSQQQRFSGPANSSSSCSTAGAEYRRR